METDFKTREAGIRRVTVAGGLVNALLMIFKFLAGILGCSAAMIADAVHSLSDFVTDIIVIVFVRISAKPEDKCHDFGHGKYETLATLLIAMFLLFVGLGIFWNAASDIYAFLLRGRPVVPPGTIALWAALVSVVLKEILYRYTLASGRRLRSSAVIANAWHHRSDAFSSVGTSLGIGGAVLLGDRWAVLDPVAALVVSLVICKVAVSMALPCLDELLEKSLPEEVEREILGLLRDFPEVSDPHRLRTRRIGSYYAIEMHLRMDGGKPLGEVHAVVSAIEARLKEVYGSSTIVSIHPEPRRQ